jgi:hypothetical protein
MTISSAQQPRQEYGFGSFVKKITRPIKKIAKSPLGKAAMLGAGLYGLNKFGIPGMSGKGSGFFGNMGRSAFNWARQNKGKAALLGLGAAGVTAPFLGGEEEEEVIEDTFDVTPSSISNIRQMARDRHPSLMFLPKSDYVQEGFFTGAKDGGIIGLANGGNPAQAQAEQMLKMEYQKYRNQGGTMSYQQFKMQVLQQAQGQGPMAQGQPQMAPRQMAAEGGIMDLGGMEKDYRQEGGFVPIGGEERADDVPARLSKNEFVFTADAVRAAGGGDIDQGAEVMENLMENLEAGGQISEESQGLGGEEMISEEEMIQAPDGAQEMYEQQAMLQSRME